VSGEAVELVDILVMVVKVDIQPSAITQLLDLEVAAAVAAAYLFPLLEEVELVSMEKVLMELLVD
jgi:hypothetical protein